MELRKYTVKELDDLRKVVRHRYLFGTSYQADLKNMCSRSYNEHQLIVDVEESVRTHMTAGHIALDILIADGYIPPKG